jgi:hypothetical protein
MIVDRCSPENMQRAWRQSEPIAGPYALADQLGQAGIAMTHAFTSADRKEVVKIVLATCTDPTGAIASKEKLNWNALAILAGFALGSGFNGIDWAAEEPGSRDAKVIATAG